jgi:membrane protein
MIVFIRSLMRRLLTDNISFLAGGVAFYGLFALFPAMAALISLFGLIANPFVVQQQLEDAQAFFPPQVYELLHEQVLTLLKQTDATLSLTAVISILVAVYSATRGTKAMLLALNMVFRVTENRSWWLRQGIAIFITLGGLMTLILALFILVAIPLILKLLPPDIATLVAAPIIYLRWLLLAGSILFGIMLLLAMGPNLPLRQQRIGAVTLGALVATVFWVVGAALGSWVIQKLPNFHATYGSLSAVTVLMLWMVSSAYAVLLGAAVTATLDYPHKEAANDGSLMDPNISTEQKRA